MKKTLIGIGCTIAGLAYLGGGVRKEAPSQAVNPVKVSYTLQEEARNAIRDRYYGAKVREVYYYEKRGVICGQVMHSQSTVGFSAFAFSKSLGLTVAKNWRDEQRKPINESYGCQFLSVQESKNWTGLYWGGVRRDAIYIRNTLAL